jgi:uncharacterized 2Fe-2S/4Fe-4S cluster protein (DUF4445 family)
MSSRGSAIWTVSRRASYDGVAACLRSGQVPGNQSTAGQSAGNTALTAAELLVADTGAALCLQQIQAVTRLARVEEATSFADSYLENLYLRPME